MPVELERREPGAQVVDAVGRVGERARRSGADRRRRDEERAAGPSGSSDSPGSGLEGAELAAQLEHPEPVDLATRLRTTRGLERRGEPHAGRAGLR